MDTFCVHVTFHFVSGVPSGLTLRPLLSSLDALLRQLGIIVLPWAAFGFTSAQFTAFGVYFLGVLAILGACFWCPCGAPSLPLQISTLSLPLHDLWLSHLLAGLPLSVNERMIPKLETSKSMPGRFFELHLSGCLKLLLSLTTVQSLHWDLFVFYEIFVCLPLLPTGLILWKTETVSDYLATS